MPLIRAVNEEKIARWYCKLVVALTRLDAKKYNANRPLSEIHILNLIQALAEPVAVFSRWLRCWNVWCRLPFLVGNNGLLHDTAVGKYYAEFDLRNQNDRQTFEDLLQQADGYRTGVLAALGYSEREKEHKNPNLIDIKLSDYSWTGSGAIGEVSIVLYNFPLVLWILADLMETALVNYYLCRRCIMRSVDVWSRPEYRLCILPLYYSQ